MNRQPRLIRQITEFRQSYSELGAGDAVVGTLPLRPGEGFKLLDLADRGVSLFPPALAQVLNSSKVAQAEVLADYLVPGSFVAYALADLAGHLPEFQESIRGRWSANGTGPTWAWGSASGPPWRPFTAWRASRHLRTPWWCSLFWPGPGT